MPAIRRVKSLGLSWPMFALAVAAFILLTACEGSSQVAFGGPLDPETGDVFDMTGTWTMTLNPIDPPWVVVCTEDLVGVSVSFCPAFEVTVTQDGMFFLPVQEPEEGDAFCDSFFAMTGSSTVQEITGVISRTSFVRDAPPMSEVQDLEFRAGVVGDNGDFRLARLTIRDVQGECTLGGSYMGFRTAPAPLPEGF